MHPSSAAFIQGHLAAAFPFLSADEVGIVSEHTGLEEVPEGTNLYVPGSAAESCYLILEGCLAIKMVGGLGVKSQVIALLYPYAPLGERGIIEPLVRTVTVTAAKNSRVATLSRASFDKLQVEQPQLAIRVLKHLLLKNSRRLENVLNGFPASSEPPESFLCCMDRLFTAFGWRPRPVFFFSLFFLAISLKLIIFGFFVSSICNRRLVTIHDH